MSLRLEFRRMAVLAMLGLPSLLGLARVVRADAASASWGGSVEGRANLYQETSTRAVVPEIEVQLSAPSGLRLAASYLVDVISSASIAQSGDEDSEVFTELRHGVGVELSDELQLAEEQVELSANGSFSTEDDYKSISATLGSVLVVDQRATRLGLSLGYAHDEIRSNQDPSFARSLRGLTAGLGFERVIHPRVVLKLGYRLGHLQGFLANAYRRVLLGPLPVLETHPRRRVRHNATAGLLLSVPYSDTAIHLTYRAYLDSWDIAALTPELGVYQEVARDLLLAAHYRYYAQTAAYFYRAEYPVGWSGPVTNDPKMNEMQTHTIGGSVSLRVGGQPGSLLGLDEEGWFDIGIERYLSTSAYGDGLIATAGVRLGF